MHRHWREVSAFSRQHAAFAASTQEARDAVAEAISVHGEERVIRTHALAASHAAKGKIPGHYYARMFYGSGLAARMAALDLHDAATRAAQPTRMPERDEESIDAFVAETLGSAAVAPLPRHESLPAPRMSSVGGAEPASGPECSSEPAAGVADMARWIEELNLGTRYAGSA